MSKNLSSLSNFKEAKLENGVISAHCPTCNGAFSNHTLVHTVNSKCSLKGIEERFCLTQCIGCGSGGIAKSHFFPHSGMEKLLSFWPQTPILAEIPEAVPLEIEKELREAEECMSIGAWRAASAMLRSTLEKTLKANGYNKESSLYNKINALSDEGLITNARKKLAHELIRVLGNDVLHEEWREVSEEETYSAHHYVQRILEDLYDDRETVEKILIEKGRL